MKQETRDDIAAEYFDQLEFDPYPVQEEALLAWFTQEQGIMVCAPTGTGKTLIAEAAIFEALRLGKTAYYTTPLIALTDQKFRDLQESAVRWGFSDEDVGLVTGNRKVNPEAKIQVVVAEILLNRLLHPEAFDFQNVWAVVMDEFHSFNDESRGIVWEFGLGLLPPSVKTLLLSATVGNAFEFSRWLENKHQRELKLIEGHERKVPLSFHWEPDSLLPDFCETMVDSDETLRKTPALIFCFNRELCWSTAELLKGKKVLLPDQQKQITTRLADFDFSEGVGPKIRQLLLRGVGVHHAGVLPKYRRIVEELFQDKLLSFCVCTETLAAGINLPARSIVLPTLLKGPVGKMKLIEPSSAHQMFGRAGRPQFDDRGYVFALPHEDDVKILRWQEKFDSIPADTKDPGLLKAKKQLKKKQPKRRDGFQYWNQSQFDQLVNASSANLASRGAFPWRLLVYMLDLSPEIEPIRQLVDKRLLTEKAATTAHKQLTRMLKALHYAGYVMLSPPPGSAALAEKEEVRESSPDKGADSQPAKLVLDLGQRNPQRAEPERRPIQSEKGKTPVDSKSEENKEEVYRPTLAEPTEKLPDLLKLRGVHPLYALFLMNHLGVADRNERIQAFESLLELPRSLGRAVWVPKLEDLPAGPLAESRLDPQLLKLGLATSEEIYGKQVDEDEPPRSSWSDDEPVFVLSLGHKLHRLFEHDFPMVDDVRVWPCWVAGELLEFDGNFNNYITSKKLQKQEGMIFRHLLRMVLLIDELAQLCPPDIEERVWKDELGEIADRLETSCREVDSYSTDMWLDDGKQKADI